MSKQAKFFDLPSDETPYNRRVYNAAKKPFELMWAFISWVGKPFLYALPFALFFSFGAAILLASNKGAEIFTSSVAYTGVTVGLVWTLYLGAVFLVVKMVAALVD